MLFIVLPLRQSFKSSPRNNRIISPHYKWDILPKTLPFNMFVLNTLYCLSVLSSIINLCTIKLNLTKDDFIILCPNHLVIPLKCPFNETPRWQFICNRRVNQNLKLINPSLLMKDSPISRCFPRKTGLSAVQLHL